MADRTFELTRRRLLGGVVTVAAAGAATGAGTMAVFGDSATSTGNTVEAGTLNLTADGNDGTVQFLTEIDVTRNDSGTSTLTVANQGSVAGYVDVQVASLTNFENGCTSNEKSRDSTCGDPGEGDGELDQHFETEAYFQSGPTVWSRSTAASELNQGDVYDIDYQLGAGQSDDFVLDWWLPSSAGREAQSDSVQFALTFSLDQRSDAGL